MVFVGRTRELEVMEDIRHRKGVKTCIISGRRRRGKSELVQEFCRGRRSLIFEFTVGTWENQLVYMTDVMSAARGEHIDTYGTEGACMEDIVQYCRESETVVVFDEFQYLTDSGDFDAPSVIRHFVETQLDGTETMVVICGTHGPTMQRLVSNTTGRLSGMFEDRIDLGPLSLEECMELHPSMSDVDNLGLYLTIGGIPGFHTASDADTYNGFVWDLFLRPHAPLRDDMMLCIGLDIPQDSGFERVLRATPSEGANATEISENAGLKLKDCDALLGKLVELDVLGTCPAVHGSPGNPKYYISEPAVAFYYQVCEANRARIDPKRFERTMESLGPEISTFLGVRFGIMRNDT